MAPPLVIELHFRQGTYAHSSLAFLSSPCSSKSLLQGCPALRLALLHRSPKDSCVLPALRHATAPADSTSPPSRVQASRSKAESQGPGSMSGALYFSSDILCWCCLPLYKKARVVEIPIDWGGSAPGRGSSEHQHQHQHQQAASAESWSSFPSSSSPSSSSSADLDREFRPDVMVKDNTWLEHKRKGGAGRVPPPFREHLKGMKWEVLVVNKPGLLNAFCLPGGKIVVFTGLLTRFPEDVEVATILGHEVGHIVARHGAERVSQGIVLGVLQLGLALILSQDFNGLINLFSQLLFALPFSRMHELEADKIGLLLMASAGYDPSIAPSVYERLHTLEVEGEQEAQHHGGKKKDSKAVTPLEFFSTHPASDRRAALLRKSDAMKEAEDLYAAYLERNVQKERFFIPF